MKTEAEYLWLKRFVWLFVMLVGLLMMALVIKGIISVVETF